MHENIQNEFGKIIKSLKRQVEKLKTKLYSAKTIWYI